MSKEFDPSVEILKEVTKEIAKSVYEDGAQPAVQAVGKALGTVFNCFNLLLAPLERAQLTSAAQTEKVREGLEEGYQLIPPEKRQEPNLKIVYQISDKLKYSLDSDELREKYINLLISSMTQGRTVHPLFVDVIDKMMSEEAKLFTHICDNALSASISAGRFNLGKISYGSASSYVLFPSHPAVNKVRFFPEFHNIFLHMEALERLGLIERNYDASNYKGNLIYDGSSFGPPIGRLPELAEWIGNQPDSEENIHLAIAHRCRLTVFGAHLFNALKSPDDMREFNIATE